MRLNSEHIIPSKFAVEQLKERLSNSFETMDTLKFEEFNPSYKNYTDSMKAGLRSHSINNPNIHYLGKFFQGHFELKSPRYFFWRNVIVRVRHGRKDSKVYIELENFWLTMIPILIFFTISLFSTIFDPFNTWVFLLISLALFSWKLLKISNTINYFKKYAS